MSTLGSGLEVADKYFATPASTALNYPVTKGVQGVNYLADSISGQQNYLANNGYDQNFWTGLGVTAGAALASHSVAQKFPTNMGFAEGPYPASLIPGATIDRYGYMDGYFVAPSGTPIANRSLLPSTSTSSLNTFEVIKPIQVSAGKASPFYNQPGGGIQFQLPKSTSALIEEGYLKLKNN